VRQLPSKASAADRARWLAEVGKALSEAQALVWQIRMAGQSSAARAVYPEIQAALIEVQALRLAAPEGLARENDQERMENPPWTLGTPRG
jgi:hypothetical protein